MLSLIIWIGLMNGAVSMGACATVVYFIYYVGLCEGVKIAVGLCSGYYLLALTAGLLLLKGLYDKRPAFIVPVLTLQFLEALVLIGGYILGTILFIANDMALWLILFSPVGLAFNGFFIYYWINLYKYYRQEKEEKNAVEPNDKLE